MSLGNPTAYRRLASIAAGRIGSSSPNIVRAILAQWQCEQPANTWPPVRNNPGFNAQGWASALGYRYRIDYPNPQPSNPIVTYYSPEDGAAAYGDGIRKFARYSAARAAAARGDGPGYLRAVTSAGYGTRLSCCLAAYGAGNADLASDDVNAGGAEAVAKVVALLERLGISTDRAHVITKEEAGRIADAVVADPSIPIRGIISGKTVGQLLDAAGAGKYLPGNSPTDALNNALAALPDAIAGLPEALGNVLVHVGLLLAVLGLIALGLYLLVTSTDGATASP